MKSKQKLTRKRIEIRNFKISNMKKLQKQGISRLPRWRIRKFKCRNKEFQDCQREESGNSSAEETRNFKISHVQKQGISRFRTCKNKDVPVQKFLHVRNLEILSWSFLFLHVQKSWNSSLLLIFLEKKYQNIRNFGVSRGEMRNFKSKKYWKWEISGWYILTKYKKFQVVFAAKTRNTETTFTVFHTPQNKIYQEISRNLKTIWVLNHPKTAQSEK